MLILTIGAGLVVVGLGVTIWKLSQGIPCPACHGLGASQAVWDRAGFGGPTLEERCEMCAGTGRLTADPHRAST